MDLHIPASLRDRVHYKNGVLRFRKTSRSRIQETSLEVLNLFRSPSIRSSTEVRVSKQGIRVGLGYPWSIPHLGQSIRLVGALGEPANLFTNGATHPLLFTSVQPPEGGPWTTKHILWLGRSIANLLQIPWKVEWDVDGWDQWNRDPILRGRLKIDAMVKKSKQNFPKLYEYRLEEPAGAVSLERAIYRLRPKSFEGLQIELGQKEVQSKGWTLPWESIHGTGVVFTRTTTIATEGRLWVSYQDQIMDILWLPRLQPIEAVYLRYIEKEIRTRCRQFKPQEGTSEDVPAHLKRLP